MKQIELIFNEPFTCLLFWSIFKLNEKYLELPKHAICSRLNQVFIRKDNEHLSQYETLLVENGPGGIFSVLQLETVNQKLFAMFVKEKVGCLFVCFSWNCDNN